jgi:hypothetical protein
MQKTVPLYNQNITSADPSDECTLCLWDSPIVAFNLTFSLNETSLMSASIATILYPLCVSSTRAFRAMKG